MAKLVKVYFPEGDGWPVQSGKWVWGRQTDNGDVHIGKSVQRIEKADASPEAGEK